MEWWREVWNIINNGKTSTGRSRDGRRINNATTFKGLSVKRHEEINDVIESQQKAMAMRIMKTCDSREDVIRRAQDLSFSLVNYRPGNTPLITRVSDTISARGVYATQTGGISNGNTMVGVQGQDPALNFMIAANLWLSPMDVAAILTQKGLFETILKKKSKSVLLNGVRIECSGNRLTPEQLERVAESADRNNLSHEVANGLFQSLSYGGALTYPMFKKDTPATMGAPMELLARMGVVGKGCIDRYVTLDRMNAIVTPNYDPTARDFLDPDYYYIPYIGADVNHERCARIVTSPNPGYWGNLLTLGWGLSDIIGWYRPIVNCNAVLDAIPNMINQMSLLVRTFNIEGVLATEGMNAVELLNQEETMKVRDASINNPINMDVIGKLEAVNRDFAQVPELVRLVRQHGAAHAEIPEELIWSSERGAFASGDTTDSAYEKQSEGTRYTHIDVARQLKRIAQIEVINALGTGRDVIAALPYVNISFDNPRVTNAKDKAEIGGTIMEGMFKMTASGFPLDVVADVSSQFADYEFRIPPHVQTELKRRQAEKDAREKEKHELEMELLQKQIDAPTPVPGAGTGIGKPKTPKSDDDKKKGHSYKDPLEQKKHEKVGAGKQQGLQKAQNKGAQI